MMSERQPLKLLVASGIYPPDVGGPATHAATITQELRRRGHAVHVVTFVDGKRVMRADGTTGFPRGWHWARRQTALAGWVARHSRKFDLLYTTGLQSLAILSAKASGLPVVAKVVGDPAWERSQRLGLTSLDNADFRATQTGGLQIRAMKRLRDWAIHASDRIVVPSEYLRSVVADLIKDKQVVTIPNGVVAPARGSVGPTRRPGELHVVFVGRLLPLKNVDVLVRGVALTRGVSLDVIGDGPDGPELATLVESHELGGRVRLLGRLDHPSALARIASADALCLASDIEGFPHAAIEALACGVPVISTKVGGVAEIIAEGENGIFFEAASPEAVSDVLSALRDDSGLLERLRAGAASSGAAFGLQGCVDRLEALFVSMVERPSGRAGILANQDASSS